MPDETTTVDLLDTIALADEDVLFVEDMSEGASKKTTALALKSYSNVGVLSGASLPGTHAGEMTRTAADVYAVRKHNVAAVVDPDENDDDAAGYVVGSLWVNVTLARVFRCVDDSTGAAAWARLDAFTSIDLFQGVPSLENPAATTDRMVLSFSGGWINVTGGTYGLTDYGDVEIDWAAVFASYIAGDIGTEIDSKIAAADIKAPVIETTTARTLTDADHGRMIFCTNVGGCSITIDAETLSAGFECDVIAQAATVTIDGASTGTPVVPAGSGSGILIGNAMSIGVRSTGVGTAVYTVQGPLT